MDLAEVLECSICLEQLSHQNKVLPCQHTFCTQCLKDVYKKRQELECPECRNKVSETIDSLPPNILANRILESLGQQARLSVSVSPGPVTHPHPPGPPLRPAPALPLPRKPPSSVREPVSSSSPVLSPVHIAPSIPGNHQTNPFIDLIDASSYYDQQMDLCSKMSKSQIQERRSQTSQDDRSIISPLPTLAVAPPRPPSSLTPSSSLISSPGSSGPPLPDRNKDKQPAASLVTDSTKQWQLSPRALIDPPRSSPKSSSLSSSSIVPTSQVTPVYRAVFEYEAAQKDEMSLRKGELYHVTERCHDGWFKGKNVKTGKIGVFPGNYVKEYDGKQAKKGKPRNVTEGSLIDFSDEDQRRGQAEDSKPETDAERLAKLKAIRETLRQAQHQMSAGQAGAVSQSKTRGEKYRCVVPFPASSEYEVELQLGDVVTLVKRRGDGWCKGTHHRTGKTGLFPASFVDKI